MKERIHTSSIDRDLTVDGLSKHNNEPMAMKGRAPVETVRITEDATIAKSYHKTGI